MSLQHVQLRNRHVMASFPCDLTLILGVADKLIPILVSIKDGIWDVKKD